MSITIESRVDSLCMNQSSRISESLNASLQKLSSLKADRGIEGPAATKIISEQQQAKINDLQKTVADSKKAIDLLRTTEGALNEITSLLSEANNLALSSVFNENREEVNANQAEIKNTLIL